MVGLCWLLCGLFVCRLRCFGLDGVRLDCMVFLVGWHLQVLGLRCFVVSGIVFLGFDAYYVVVC